MLCIIINISDDPDETYANRVAQKKIHAGSNQPTSRTATTGTRTLDGCSVDDLMRVQTNTMQKSGTIQDNSPGGAIWLSSKARGRLTRNPLPQTRPQESPWAARPAIWRPGRPESRGAGSALGPAGSGDAAPPPPPVSDSQDQRGART
jgi:hypothetical protein